MQAKNIVKKCSNCASFNNIEYKCECKQFQGAKALDSLCIMHNYKYWKEGKLSKSTQRNKASEA